MKVPAGTQTHTLFRLRRSGLPDPRGRGKGDLFVRVVLVTPRNLTAEERKAFEKMAGAAREKSGFFDRFK